MKAEELKKELAEKGGMILLDVREADEFKPDEAIPNSQNMPMGKVFVEASKGNLPKDQKIITICKSGGRCEIVARELKERGYNIEHLEGGLKAWREEENS